MSKLEDDLEEALHGVGFNHFRLCDCAPTLSDLIRAFRCAGWAPACERGEDAYRAALIRLAEQEAEKRMVWSLERHESEGDTVLARYPTKPTAAALRRDIPSALSDEDIARLLVADPEFRATATCSFISETVEGTFSDYFLWAVAFDDPIDSAALASRGAAHG